MRRLFGCLAALLFFGGPAPACGPVGDVADFLRLELTMVDAALPAAEADTRLKLAVLRAKSERLLTEGAALRGASPSPTAPPSLRGIDLQVAGVRIAERILTDLRLPVPKPVLDLPCGPSK